MTAAEARKMTEDARAAKVTEATQHFLPTIIETIFNDIEKAAKDEQCYVVYSICEYDKKHNIGEIDLNSFNLIQPYLKAFFEKLNYSFKKRDNFIVMGMECCFEIRW